MQKTFKMSAQPDFFKQFRRNIFIETGSGYGDGIQMALNAGFNKIYSIELSKLMYNNCLQKFKDNSKVNLIFGNSVEILPLILSSINEPVTFWLDAHCSGGDTVGGATPPLMNELHVIGKHHIKEHTILIDDLRSWGELYVNLLANKILNINPHYRIIFADGSTPDDILIAKI